MPAHPYAGPTRVARRAIAVGLKRLEPMVPRRLRVNEPVLQLFLHGDGKRTEYTFTDFPSLYAPNLARPCAYDLELFDYNGAPAGKTRITLPPFGSATVRLEQRLSGPLPGMGVLSAQIVSSSLFDRSAAHLGMLTAQFYAAYFGDETGSVALVHPQTTRLRIVPPRSVWRSDMPIETAAMAGLEAYQINPTPQRASSTLSLTTLNGQVVATHSATVAPLGAMRVGWSAEELRSGGPLVLASDGLVAPNAKPILFRSFAGGAFTAAHS